MAYTPFKVEIITPDGEAFNGEVEMLSTTTTVGSIGVLAGHQPLLAMLEPTALRLHRSDDQVETYAQGEGYLQVAESKALVIVDELTRPEQLNRADLEERLSRARRDFSEAEDGSEKERRAKRRVKRYETFLGIAS